MPLSSSTSHPLYLPHDLREHIDGGRRAVELTSAMVRDDDAGDAVFDGEARRPRP